MQDEEKDEEKSKKQKLMDEGYEGVKFKASNFKAGYKLKQGDVEYDLQAKDLHIEFDGDVRQLVAVFDAQGYLRECPMCHAECPEDSMVILTDHHMLYPCWVCNQLVERLTGDDVMDWSGLE